MMGWAIAGLLMLRFWRRTQDRFFLIFALAFWLFGIENIISTFAHLATGASAYVYLVRLAAFLLILAAIVDKNRATRH